MRLPLTFRSDYLLWDPPRYQNEHDRPTKADIAPAPIPQDPTALFFSKIRCGKVCKKPFDLQFATHIRRQHSHDRNLSLRQRDKKRKQILKDLTWEYEEIVMAVVRHGGRYIEYKNLFASSSARWDRFSPYIDTLSDCFAAAFKQDTNEDALASDAKVLLAMGQPVNTLKAVTYQPTRTLSEGFLPRTMEIETDPAATQAALQRWADSLTIEAKRVQALLEDFHSRNASINEWEGEVAQLKKTWHSRLRSLDQDEENHRCEVCVPVRKGKCVTVTLSFPDEPCKPGSPTVGVMSSVETSASSDPLETKCASGNPTHQQCSGKTGTVEADDGIVEQSDGEDFEDQYLLALAKTFGSDFATAVQTKGVKAGTSSNYRGR